ncbi:MAG: glycoside hydrolase family 5 protein [Xanthobacteraceae bacterium]|nr:glycoside hydrolase family 5 protein [Xanthobacteraceae bacterium]
MTIATQMFRLVAVVLAGLWLAQAQAAEKQAEAPAFQRGIAIAHTMAWAQIEPGPSKAFVFPPFMDQGRRLDRAELQALTRAGFDFVRLAVDPGPFLQFTGARRERAEQILLEQVRLILASGLAVIVDFHPSDLHPNYTGAALTGGVATPAFRDYLRLLERTAVQLDALKSRRVAFELMNEPPVSPAVWQPMLEAAYHAVRKVAPRLLLVLPGASEGMVEGLLGLKPAAFRDDPAVIYTFHYYEPFQFTHQGASWNAARHLADVPYPATARPLRDSLEATAAAIESSPLSQVQRAAATLEARRLLESYRRSGFDRAAMAKSLDRITVWAKSNGIPADRILLGEFGALKSPRQAHGLRAAERRQWFADVRSEAEARGFSWAVWVYRLGGFEVVDGSRGVDIDPDVAAALGLKSPSRHSAAPAK